MDPFRNDELGHAFIVPFKCDKLVLDPDTSIDITHEALIRCCRSSGTSGHAGRRRPPDTRLAMRAEDEGSRPQMFLEGSVLQRVSDWWQERKPNEAWAARYHAGFGAADAYLRASLDKLKEEEARKESARQEEEARKGKARQEEEARRLDDARRDAEVRASTFKKRAAYGAAAVSVLGIGVLGYLLITTINANLRTTQALMAASQAEARRRVAQGDLVTQLLASRSALAAHDGGAALLSSLLLAATSLDRSPTVEAQSSCRPRSRSCPRTPPGRRYPRSTSRLGTRAPC